MGALTRAGGLLLVEGLVGQCSGVEQRDLND